MTEKIIYIPDLRDSSLTDSYKYILHKICEQGIFDKANESGFVNLYSLTLRDVLGNDYKEAVSYLISNNYIESDNTYSIGAKNNNGGWDVIPKSKGYKLTPDLSNLPLIKDSIKDATILKRLTRNKQPQPEGIEYQAIKDNLYTTDISNKALKFVNDYDYSYTENPEQARNHRHNIIERITDKEHFYYPVSEHGNRCYHTITSLPRELRQYLSYKHNRLIEIDISNSQPFLFNILLYKKFAIESKSISKRLNFDRLRVPKDVNKYRYLTEAGLFYSYMAQSLNAEVNKEFKRRLFKHIFYNEISCNYQYKDFQIFQEQFPNVANYIIELKQNDYRELSWKLQQAESLIMINTIGRELAKRNIYFLPIHDSYLVQEQDTNRVKQTIQYNFKNKLGFIPKLH